jgi:hypothetical protein
VSCRAVIAVWEIAVLATAVRELDESTLTATRARA